MAASSTEKINATIANSNPFETLAIVREQDVWESGFPDLTTINAHASDAILQALREVRSTSSTHQKIKTRAIGAMQGTGKTHILARLRRHCDREKEAFFIYAGVERYSLNAIEQEFHKTVATSLDKTGSAGVTQWQELATLMVNNILKATNPNSRNVTEKQLIKKFANLDKTEGKTRQWVKIITSKFNKIYKQFDPDAIAAIFWTLSESQSRHAVKWLSGQDLPESKAKQLGLPMSGFGAGQTTSGILDSTLQILSLIAEYKSILIGIDELDLPDSQRSKTGLARPQVVARLIKKIVDRLSVSATGHGVIILTVMMPDTWTRKVKSMPGGVPDRVSGTEQPLQLTMMNADAAVELVKLWLDEFYKGRKLVPPTPIYPFDEQKIREIAEGNSVRDMLRWCAENFRATSSDPVQVEGRKPPKSLSNSPVEQAYQKELAKLGESEQSWSKDRSAILSAILFGFKFAKGKTIENVTVESLEPVEPKSKNRQYISFKVVGTEDGKAVKIGISVMQNSASRTIGAALRRLVKYEMFDMTRGCLVRTKKISPTAHQAKALLDKLISKQLGGEWVRPMPDDVKSLLALSNLYNDRKNYQLTPKEIVDFIEQSRLIVDNELIREILSDPSGQIPDNLEEEE